jgi:hypothetical protein
MSDEPNMPDYVLDATRSLVDEVRRLDAARPSPGWHVVFPAWIIAHAGGWDAFAEQFEASHLRTGVGYMGVIGFEIPAEDTHLPARRYTLKRYRQETPE